MEKLRTYWFNMPDKFRFLLIGGVNAGTSYIIFSIICLTCGTEIYQIALAFTWIISSVISFTTQKFLVFRGNGAWVKEYCKCCTTWFFSYMINASLLEIFVKYLKLNVFVGQIISTLISAIFTYILFKKFAFKKCKN